MNSRAGIPTARRNPKTAMKLLITSDCLRAGGAVVTAGTILTDTTEDERRDLIAAGRAQLSPDEPAKAEPEPPAPKAKK